MAKPFAAAINHQDGRLAIFSHGTLSLFTPDAAGHYSLTRDANIDTEKGALLAFVGSRIVLATGDGQVRILDASSLTGRNRSHARGSAKPRKLTASPDGRRLAVLFDDGHVWLYDVEQQQPLRPRIGSQGDITAITFSPENRLLVADGFGRVNAYRLDPFERGNAYLPTMDTLQILYRFVVTPLYTIFPKPGELNDVVTIWWRGTHRAVSDQREALAKSRPRGAAAGQNLAADHQQCDLPGGGADHHLRLHRTPGF